MKRFKHGDLVDIYKQGVEADKEIFAEQRSNLLLVAGNHYARKNSKFYDRIRENSNISQEQKIRLTKNHIQRICKIYENNLLSYAPGVAVLPRNDSELQDQKAAELNNAVWQDIKIRHNFSDKIREYVQDYQRIGECAVKIFWDENKGYLKGFEGAVDDEGQPIIGEDGQPVADKSKPIFSGDVVFERIFAFNLFRAREAKSMQESPFLGIRKMMPVKELEELIPENDDRRKYIQATKDETYHVYDGQGNGYNESKNECMIVEVFIRPCMQYPKGYFYIYTMVGILWEGELPFGMFPIHYVGFDEVPTNPRCHSLIKQLRPYQAEVNRAASKMAEHQITLGDDKLLIQAGTKIQNGGNLPGVRAIQYAGQAPSILPGRSGDQYVQYIQQNIDEMYIVANLSEDNQEKPAQIDPYTMLFMSMDQRKKYSIYASKMSQFLIGICGAALDVMKNYAPDDMIIPAIGRSEIVNISEFKNTQSLFYQIKLEAGNDDAETKLGKQLTFNNILQYVGSNLDPKDIGKMIRNSPYVNNEQSFDDLTMDYDNANNMLLALDRGKPLKPSPYDDATYMIKRLVNRMRKADFQYLSPEIQQMYSQLVSTYEDIDAEQKRKLQEAALGYIPMSGMAVVCDLYVPDPSNSSKTMRARVPYDALTWLLKRLEEQGASQDSLMKQQQGVMADIASRLISNPAQAQQPANPMQPALNQQQ